MTELRRRMEDDMVARGFAARTRESYLWAVTGLARFYRRSPDQISEDAVQAYLVHLLRERQLSSSTCNVVVCGLRFFYQTTLKRARTTFDIPLSRQPGKLPVILSRGEVARVLAHVTNLKHRTMLLTTYAAGLRLNEVLHLRVADLDSGRMTIRVEQGKGSQDRYTVLSPPCSPRSATTGNTPTRARGCFLPRLPGSRCMPRRSNGRTTLRSTGRVSRSPAGFTACGTRLPHTCSRVASTCTRFNASSDTGI
jgi:integrase